MSAVSTAEIARGLRLAGWSPGDLWWAALAIGGSFSPFEIELIVAGYVTGTPGEHDILAATLNEYFSAEGRNHPVRYWEDLPPR